MILMDITNFFGRLHPLVVHLPIGFLALAIIFDLISYHKKYNQVRPAVSLIMLAGFLSSILAALLGYLLSLTGEYDRDTLSAHKISGIALTVMAGLLYLGSTQRFMKIFPVSHKVRTGLVAVLLGVLVYTGHQGANLTHGSDYITLSLLTEKKSEKPSSVEEALLYEDVVQPILAKKCVSCHRQGKKKGRLSLETIAMIKKGGKNGPGITAGNQVESEIIKRITLDPSHEDFMPADGKTPLTKAETAILKWWIEKGMMEEGKKIAMLKNSNEIRPHVAAFLQMTGEGTNAGEIEQNINPAIPKTVSMNAIEKLRKQGIRVRLMLHKPVMLDITLPPGSKAILAAASNDLKAVAMNVIWLNLSENGLSGKDLEFLPLMKNITKLRLAKNAVSDEICTLLAPMSNLEAVNVNETNISDECVQTLKKMPSMKRVYHWQPTKN